MNPADDSGILEEPSLLVDLDAVSPIPPANTFRHPELADGFSLRGDLKASIFDKGLFQDIGRVCREPGRAGIERLYHRFFIGRAGQEFQGSRHVSEQGFHAIPNRHRHVARENQVAARGDFDDGLESSPVNPLRGVDARQAGTRPIGDRLNLLRFDLDGGVFEIELIAAQAEHPADGDGLADRFVLEPDLVNIGAAGRFHHPQDRGFPTLGDLTAIEAPTLGSADRESVAAVDDAIPQIIHPARSGLRRLKHRHDREQQGVEKVHQMLSGGANLFFGTGAAEDRSIRDFDRGADRFDD